MRPPVLALGCVVVTALSAACMTSEARVQTVSVTQSVSPALRASAARTRAAHELEELQHRYLRWPEDDQLFADAARTAWTFVARQHQPSTGFFTAIPGYPFATVWDVGSMFAALYSARELGLLDDATYVARVNQLLTTLARVDLYDDRVLNMAYHTRTAAMASRGAGRGNEWGWSTTDLGRLLVWLRILATDSRFTSLAESVVRRNDFASIVRDGYLWGEVLDDPGHARTYQEGRLGYEQYAARGFALWGFRADKALDLRQNALPVRVMNQTLVADVRRWDRLTSEPFVLWGLEVGWDGEAAALARRLLQAQAERYNQTGALTLVGEDAVDVAPHYFYYYCLYANGKAFSVDTPDPLSVVDDPRWVSTKSAFGFHALLPTEYTATVVRSISGAQIGSGWASGVFEASGASTHLLNINTAAVILTAAVVHQRGGPILAHAQRQASE